jgi:hypothetical protein
MLDLAGRAAFAARFVAINTHARWLSHKAAAPFMLESTPGHKIQP